MCVAGAGVELRKLGKVLQDTLDHSVALENKALEQLIVPKLQKVHQRRHLKVIMETFRHQPRRTECMALTASRKGRRSVGRSFAPAGAGAWDWRLPRRRHAENASNAEVVTGPRCGHDARSGLPPLMPLCATWAT